MTPLSCNIAPPISFCLAQSLRFGHDVGMRISHADRSNACSLKKGPPMKKRCTQSHFSLSSGLARLASALVMVMLDGTTSWLAAQSADFNAGTDAGWTRYSLPSTWAATFTFPPDDTGGKGYRIHAPPTGDDSLGIGNARAGSYRAEVKCTGRFTAGVDMLAWNAAWRQETGLIFYFSEVGLGTSDGYTATYSSAYRNLYISADILAVIWGRFLRFRQSF